jgi:hypothetical protein
MSKHFMKLALFTLLCFFFSAVKAVYAKTGYTNSATVTLTLSATDSGSGMGAGAEMKFSNDRLNWSTAEAYATTRQNWDLTAYGGGTADGEKTVYAKFKDSAGNWSTDEIKTGLILDTISPVTTAAPKGGNYNQTQTVTLSCSETATIYYTVDGSTPTAASTIYSTPIIISGSTTLKFFAVDNAENTETVKTEIYSLDSQAPTTTASPAGGLYNAGQTVTLAANEPATIYYTLDGSTPTTASTVYSAPITISSSTSLKFFAVDNYGNAEAPKSEQYTIDNSSPIGTLIINNGAAATNSTTVTLTITESDNGSVVGWLISETQSSKPGANDPAWKSVKPGSYTLASGDGTKTLYLWFKDNAGNVSDVAASDTILLDTIPPTGTIAIIIP